MPQRHSKNNNDLAFFTYDERRKLGYGTQKERLGKDSIKPFDACCICLKRLTDPQCCQKGHLFCKECILESLLAQKKDIKRKIALFATQQKKDQEDELERRNLEKERALEAFDRQNNSAVPHHDKNHDFGDAKAGFQGANSVKVTSYEEEALKSMKAFWLPSATPEAAERIDAPSTDTICPEGKEKLKLKQLFTISFSEIVDPEGKDTEENRYMCPSCSTTLTNRTTLVVINSCGHVLCKKCAEQFIIPEKACSVCNRPCKAKNMVTLEKGGTGFAGHDENLEAKTFKHVGSGTGMGLSRPARV
ncbi:hypothetical protein SELMODRAFT_98131 [Selaginella moellendorffii]|uniref:RING-type domain-containing protein n=1 Tax=Selaginella moellendorffii TaxID=88036 RepID=D8RPB2_SELML|nr:E3 ubiquitin-protein ligase CSU1 [Selaginella moellendorffii]XP_002984474.1 E3 ubiquitin-protein ligase CSU1 [Selaginella moellendorffii]EFJ14524.1 hypothetical protein SELMODRAFT_120430 [Selaginella moellendorffii]EFJ26226.1 hypothetical protein SELMODRAFT_98131 [Selaginella moellendorffii]|eukprot:XP_002973005.1 E3 ubiquitin-protein ligase CSU1 [Selaginella moellendorffii]